MSEDVTYAGKLRKVYCGDSLEDEARRILLNLGTEIDEYYDTYLESLKENDKYMVIEDCIYEVLEKRKLNHDFMLATQESDGTISFFVSYYNGGCCLEEAVEEAINNITKEK